MKIVLEKGQNLYFTSDTHYGHSNICRATTNWTDADSVTRDFKSLDHMNDVIVDNINSIVGENDVLIHLGDWSFGGFDNIAEFSNFCRNQQVKTAILNSVQLLEMNDFDSILQLIGKAVRAGEDKTVGLDYNLDIEARYREDDRNCIPFPWPVFNEMLFILVQFVFPIIDVLCQINFFGGPKTRLLLFVKSPNVVVFDWKKDKSSGIFF